MLSRSQKEQLVEKLTNSFRNAKSVVFSNFSALKVSDLQDLRRKLKPSGIDLRVIKSNLLEIILKNLNYEIEPDYLDKPVIVAISKNDEILPIKELVEFSKTNENLTPISALFEGKIIEQTDVAIIASLPSREQSLATLVGSLKAPLSRMVGALRWNGYALVNVLKQKLEKSN
ncbi:MAG: large subunit ribosomal protein L10 [Candidatus Berkelbacteria bacterium Licking1014_85]|uniref:Large ribosomal subunit protein uL10 n=1 Tax=Candidatus Berkelbacteria bacterium Licking1014_85 TaxID=2017148 RepID=A0A554LJ15_9BACT|nr:MAG: large subunit ribosomal protein L10 [Candidatus Berkelbacteria bacterium Licking1014_85]